MENERYKYFEFANGYKVIEETETHIEYCSGNAVVELLNQQDSKIKALEKIRDSGNLKLEALYIERLDKLDDEYNKHLEELNQEINQLKQSQNEKVIEVLGKVKNYFVEEEIDGDEIATGDWVIIHDSASVAEYIDNQIKELRGEE